MSSCPHANLAKVIDEMGYMTADENGGYSAPVLRAHYDCTDCGHTVTHTENTQAIADHRGLIQAFEYAGMAIAHAVNLIRNKNRPTQGDQP